jgi:hypothetical protein
LPNGAARPVGGAPGQTDSDLLCGVHTASMTRASPVRPDARAVRPCFRRRRAGRTRGTLRLLEEALGWTGGGKPLRRDRLSRGGRA